MKLAYLDCPTGIAGDMCLGALVHAGVPLDYLQEKLSLLGIGDEFQLRAELKHHNGQQATKVHVDLLLSHAEHQPTEEGVDTHPTFHHYQAATVTLTTTQSTPGQKHPPHSHHEHAHQHREAYASSHSHSHSHSHSPADPPIEPLSHRDQAHPRHLPEIEQMIRAAGLPTQAEAWSLAVFQNLARAEGSVHGLASDQVHFHEVGATDAIVDIVGTCLGLDWLGIDRLYCAPLPTGGGTIRAAHGRLPVPTPAVLKLLELFQVPVYSNGIERELVTPTGAAIATTLATAFGPPPPMTLQRVGLGAGNRQLEMPNILRLWLGEEYVGTVRPSALQADLNPPPQSEQAGAMQETVAVLETQIDDLNPQAIGYVFEALRTAGALDVFTQAIGMKKSRPGILLTVICHPAKVGACEAILFRETSTLGIRQSLQTRRILERELQSVPTAYGSVRVKVAWSGPDRTILCNVQPEYEDCAQIAMAHNLPWREVHRQALAAWYGQHSV
ncbi:TIGR00299 family protein [Leptolyngbya sp. 'hensonii']|uniref:nickel pincer cofactor biosynthesis protein LarC n=1 Tax=Leptolyngbya sp. 'hensonii' TaxID=1922337 RepID=UPI00094FCF1A|nr:nickel pincer cofactor biosynthesis protein LarC [Leptolyngbya sp. 'hensonii']OLP15998.1 TIGR00299 family protein [Leptolyngbya sp. 'hensonii']